MEKWLCFTYLRNDCVSIICLNVQFQWNLSNVSGELHVPLDVCGAVVKRELHYWGIDDCHIEPCCWTRYSSYIDNQKILSDFNSSVTQESTEQDILKGLKGWRKNQMRIWMILDHPSSSKLALVSITYFNPLSAVVQFVAEPREVKLLNVSNQNDRYSVCYRVFVAVRPLRLP